MKTTPPKALLFDLDGTLLDTATDIVGTVNKLLNRHGLPARPLEELKPYVSGGALMLISRGFGYQPDEIATRELWHQFMDMYLANICVHTRLFEGLSEVLEKLAARSIAWGVVTNKPERFTLPLMQAITLPCQPGSIVSGDTLTVSKPDPEPVLYACDELGVRPDQAIMIGDDERDIVAGRDAGCITLAATWGYIKSDDDPAAWGADGLISCPEEINEWLG